MPDNKQTFEQTQAEATRYLGYANAVIAALVCAFVFFDGGHTLLALVGGLVFAAIGLLAPRLAPRPRGSLRHRRSWARPSFSTPR